MTACAGESEYNKKALLGGNSSISSEGEKYAAALPAVLLSRLPQVRSPLVYLWCFTEVFVRTVLRCVSNTCGHV